MPRREAGVIRHLAAYRAKRHFEKTPEPAGRKDSSLAGGQLRYVIQKHAARRMHYDFRLELDGTLKSWAVTRGPSLDPADKRLAVHVEDHPLEYGAFEGIIPQGEYGGGIVMLWDQGSWDPIGDPRRGYKDGRLSFVLHGKRLKGEWHLVRMGRKGPGEKRENWLLIKSHDQYADPGQGDDAAGKYQTSVVSRRTMQGIAKTNKEWRSNRHKQSASQTPRRAKKKFKTARFDKPPAFVAPALATLVKKPPVTPGWIHEIKFDGYRALARIEDGRAHMLTRANNDWTGRFERIAGALSGLPAANALMDGEVVYVKDDGAMSFSALQDALGKGRQDHLHYYIFDLLFLDGRNLMKEPLLARKQALLEILPKHHPFIHFSRHFERPGTDVLRHACDIALEGIVSKRAESAYRSGRRADWLKSKCVNEQEIVIGGYTRQPRHRGRLGALLVGYYENGQLRLAGKVGTGYTGEEAAALLKRLKPLTRARPPFVRVAANYRRGAHWVEPKLVAQIMFGEWTADGHLRHASFQGLRDDKPAAQVIREKEIMPPGAQEKKGELIKRGKMSFEGVTLSNLDRVLYPGTGITKKQLADYYMAVAARMLPHIERRPISLLRCPEGYTKTCFFQRHASGGMPPYIHTFETKIRTTVRPYLMIEDIRGLLSLVQMGVLEIHIWGARIDTIDQPDRVVFDFDPGEDVPWKRVQDGAREIRDRLKELKLACFLEATGGKGLHVVVPINRGPNWKQVKEFSRRLAGQMARDAPNLYTVNLSKAERKGRIFIDYLRNGKGASFIAPYSTRARPGAPVATPLGWKELDTLTNPHPFNIESVLTRLRKDRWAGMLKLRQRLDPAGYN